MSDDDKGKWLIGGNRARDEFDQPMPTTGSGTSMQDLVIADLEKRKEIGLERYGTLLFPHNGRDMLRDAYEEALDLCVYLRGVMEEWGWGPTRPINKSEVRVELEVAPKDSFFRILATHVPSGVKAKGYGKSQEAAREEALMFLEYRVAEEDRVAGAGGERCGVTDGPGIVCVRPVGHDQMHQQWGDNGILLAEWSGGTRP